VKQLSEDLKNTRFSELLKEKGTPLPKGSVKSLSDESRAGADMVIRFLVKPNGDAILDLPKGVIPSFARRKKALVKLLTEFRASVKRDYPREHHVDPFPPGSPPRLIEKRVGQSISRNDFKYSIELHIFVAKGENAFLMPYGGVSMVLVRDISDFIRQIIKLDEPKVSNDDLMDFTDDDADRGPKR
jgi:hypothetical protein